MFEKFIQLELENNKFFNVFVYIFFISTTLFLLASYFNISIYLFLILLTLALSYPFTKFFEKKEFDEYLHSYKNKVLLKMHSQELMAVWTLFFSLTVSLTIILLYYGSALTNLQIGLSGTNQYITFIPLLLNNLGIFFLIFLLCVLSITALIFVIQWCSLLIANTLYSIGELIPTITTALLLFSYSFLQVGGFALAGFAGILLSLRFDFEKKSFKEKYLAQVKDDVLILLGIGIVLILISTILQSY